MSHNKPEKTFKAGVVRAAVFVNTYRKNGQAVPIRKVVLEVRYRDKHGQWKSSSSLSLNELPKAITALQQAYEYLLHPPPPEGPSPEAPGNPGISGKSPFES